MSGSDILTISKGKEENKIDGIEKNKSLNNVLISQPEKESVIGKEQDSVSNEESVLVRPFSAEKQSRKEEPLTPKVMFEEIEEGGLVELGKKHPLALLGINVVLCMVNISLITTCLYGVPDYNVKLGVKDIMGRMPSPPSFELIPSLPSLNLGTMGGVDMCIACSVLVLLVFLLAPLYLVSTKSPFHHVTYSKRRKTWMTVQSTKSDETTGSCDPEKMSRSLKEAMEPSAEISLHGENEDSILVKFVSQNAKLVFWTSYFLLFLNMALAILCFCNLPSLLNPCEIVPFSIICTFIGCVINGVANN